MLNRWVLAYNVKRRLNSFLSRWRYSLRRSLFAWRDTFVFCLNICNKMLIEFKFALHALPMCVYITHVCILYPCVYMFKFLL